MSQKSFAQTSRAVLVIAAMVAGLALTPAGADAYKTAVVAEDEIVITAPYTVHRDGEAVSVSRTVSVKGLDLRYASAVEELNRRVAVTAEIACDEAEDYLRAQSATTDRQCVRNAIRGARSQVAALIDRYRG